MQFTSIKGRRRGSQGERPRFRFLQLPEEDRFLPLLQTILLARHSQGKDVREIEGMGVLVLFPYILILPVMAASFAGGRIHGLGMTTIHKLV